MGYIAGIGGANMDIHGKGDRKLIMRDSNPGSLHTSLGGVCRNICENLALLGTDVKLVTVVGDDYRGKNIISGCAAAGIDSISRTQTARTIDRNLRGMVRRSFLFLWRLSVFHHQVNQENQQHRRRNSRCDQQGLDSECLIGNIQRRFFLNGLNADAADQQAMGVDAVGRAGE